MSKSKNISTPSDNLSSEISIWQKFKRKKSALFSLYFLIALFIFVFIGPYFLQDPLAQDLKLGLSSPSSQHWLGTDELGRDLLSRLAEGGKLSLMIAVLATVVSLIIGTTYGMLSGYYGGKYDQVAMRIVDVLYALPYMFLVILLISIFGKNVFILFIALGAVQWLTTARIVRGQVLGIKNQEFILACKVLGIPTRRILSRHILPNIMGVIIVYASLTVPSIILQEAFLSFLGLNVSECTWGILAAEGAGYIDIGWWLILFPGLILSATLLAFNLIGDALRDSLDSRMN